MRGKVIKADNQPLAGCHILAFDEDNILDANDFLGETVTDDNGLFEIEFDKSRFTGVLELLEGSPDVFLLLKDKEGKDILKTSVMRTKKEIEYHIKNSHQIPDANFKDIYAGNTQRMLAMLQDVGSTIGLENTINLDMLSNGNTAQEIKNMLQDFINGHQDRRDNFNHLLVIFSSLIDSYLEDLGIGTLGYNGPQVPRYPRKEEYDMVISFPHKEAFPWV